MASRFTPGDTVQTRFGKGVVREVRNGGRLKVEVQGRAMVVPQSEILALDESRKRHVPAQWLPGVELNAPGRSAQRKAC